MDYYVRQMMPVSTLNIVFGNHYSGSYNAENSYLEVLYNQIQDTK
jgi:hypothetical protein